MISTIIRTPLSTLQLVGTDEGISEILFLSDVVVPLSYSKVPPSLKEITGWLLSYFETANTQLPLHLINSVGTTFQQKVWNHLLEIPYGTTTTYGEIAKALDSSARAIGMACRTNPLPILVPCHRVVAKNSVGGYKGDTQGPSIKIKNWLLAHESKC